MRIGGGLVVLALGLVACDVAEKVAESRDVQHCRNFAEGMATAAGREKFLEEFRESVRDELRTALNELEKEGNLPLRRLAGPRLGGMPRRARL